MSLYSEDETREPVKHFPGKTVYLPFETDDNRSSAQNGSHLDKIQHEGQHNADVESNVVKISPELVQRAQLGADHGHVQCEYQETITGE